MKIIETGPREIGFVLWGHCQNILDDPRIKIILLPVLSIVKLKKKAKNRNQYNQVPHPTGDIIWESDKNTMKHKRAKRPVISQQVITRLQGTDKII